MKTPSNMKPVIITGAGDYVARNGDTVEINEVQDHSDDLTVTRFNCKGHHVSKTPSGKVKRKWGIWHQSGIHRGIGEHPLDIVGRA